MEASAKACPSALALDVGDTRLDYHGLLADVGAVGEELRSHGIGAGDRVGIRVPSGTADLYVAILAVLRVGAAYVPVDVDDPDERAELIWTELPKGPTVMMVGPFVLPAQSGSGGI
ncbi:AMP-binding protein [Actinacidiphila oryziradicis]|uniref:AMP-binding protein n=1 Tax=Actinacidiphila oryziradicis TaxID=2571141 RepID=UPI003211D366|nr:epsilon-poly-L-lysine synthase [Actinacidiphila oryziradicis]